MKAFVENQASLYSKNNWSNEDNITSDVLIIYTNNDNTECNIINKNKLTIQQLQELQNNSKNSTTCLGFSFFHLLCNPQKSGNDGDYLIGCILYDFKNQKTLLFNVSSYLDNYQGRSNSKNVIVKLCKNLFYDSLGRNSPSFNSMLKVSLLHPLYTPIPWFYFASFYPFNYDEKIITSFSFFVRIPEFFLFGSPRNISANSFHYKNLSITKKGSAAITYDLFSDKKIQYQLRFDVSQAEEFLHVDYGYFQESRMKKFIGHFPIDMEFLKNFNNRLFVSIISSGFFDPEFAEIIKEKIKNINKTIKELKELSEPFKIIHDAESKAKWLEENQLFDEYEKIFNNDDSTDLQKYYKISNKYPYLFRKDKSGIIGFSYDGLMTLVRKFKGSNQKLHFIDNYLARLSRS